MIRTSRTATATACRLAALAALAACVSCSSTPEPAEVCLKLESSPNLNSFDGQAHVVVVTFYPLQNAAGFRDADPLDLLGGSRPPGLTGDPFEATVYPGQEQEIEEMLPRDTLYLGVLADFYKGPSRTVVDAECGTFGSTKLVLSSADIQAE